MKPSYFSPFILVLFFSVNAYSQRNYNLINKESLVKIMKEQNFQLLDVRTEKEFKGGAIKGAMNIDYWDPDFEDKVITNLNKKITTIVYCAAGGRSEMACKLLLKKGFKMLYDLEGGYEKYAN